MAFVQITDVMPTPRGAWVGAWNTQTGGRLAFESTTPAARLIPGEVYDVAVEDQNIWLLQPCEAVSTVKHLDLYLPFAATGTPSQRLAIRRPKGAVPHPEPELAEAV